MTDQITEIKNKILNTLRKNDVKRASLFGSVVRGELTEESDIDILVEFGSRKSLLDLVGLKLELEDVLKRKVDVLTYNSLHPLLKDRILREQKVIL
ncbi:MAG: nucleotidyltransferase family protein [Candidatus Methanoperedens sp.]|nr:nucleotidyltransferase family protein [Candidatus Methanoperedens sp.]